MSLLSQRDKAKPTGGEATSSLPAFTPPVDIYETSEELVLLADMPGVDADDISVDLKDDTLSISGDVKSAGVSGDLLASEFQPGRYSRQFSLALEVDRENISASYRDGVLKLTLPKAAKAKPQTIQVQAG